MIETGVSFSSPVGHRLSPTLCGAFFRLELHYR